MKIYLMWRGSFGSFLSQIFTCRHVTYDTTNQYLLGTSLMERRWGTLFGGKDC
jgi:hypothetical protein